MFEKLRKPGRGKAITAYVLFGAICLVFVFFGLVPNQMGFQKGGAAAVVNNYQISQAEFLRHVQGLENQYRQQLDMLPEAQRQSQMTQLRARALEDLVQNELLYQSAAKEGVTVSDSEVREAIGSIPAFQEEGRFRRELYSGYLQSVGYSAGQFETRVRKDLVVEKVRNMFLSSFQPVKGENEKNKLLADTKMDISFVKFSQKSLEESLPVSDAEVKAYLAVPENLEKAKADYQANLASYTLNEEVKARHILLTKKPEESDADLDKKVQTALTRLKTEDFAKVAKDMSADTGSAAKGGDLGFFERGRMIPEFEKVAFSLEKGKVSEPVKTQFGVHIIKVEDKKAARTKTLEEVQSDIVRVQLAKPKVEETLTQLRTQLKEGNASAVEQSISKMGWKWDETGPFDLSSSFIPKIGANNQLLASVTANPTAGKLVPELVESGGEYYIVKVKSFTLPSGQAKSEDARSAEFFTMRRAGEAFNSWLKDQRAEAKIQLNSQLITQ